MRTARAGLAAMAFGQGVSVMKTYSVKEAYVTLQGEGAQTGRAAVFLRFAGCNLWNGLEEGRASAICQFCDTDFVGTDGPGGGKFVGPCLLYTSPSPRDRTRSRMPSSA